ncbi:PREDICTED: acid phosphatase 1-like [Nelumbo nucifera]|uniref:Acid phosphatase 1-like n=2 Tax=Nelumbo nucifera TaxID=4432 RepID=A0A1U7ZDR9_NELNU|nr:PREDICTED: acid phosphatase 1-like [Nelumbo nucifera]DAD44558.1 TPA_asm: hypothetical protein HUJ06_002788 [Nelumbo nucifera]
MDPGRLIFLLFFWCLASGVASESVLKILPENRKSARLDLVSRDRKFQRDDGLFCDSWRLSVETNNVGFWKKIPQRCASFMKEYISGDHYASDSDVVAQSSLAFAETVELSGDGKDAWIFDIDETLLSNFPYYELHDFGLQEFDERTFNVWVDMAEAPPLPPSQRLYKQLQQLGFTLILLTGRSEAQRDATEKNLLVAGYHSWEKLILRGPSDQGKPAIIYKSEKRMELEAEGYRIHGSSGDQWSDLLGFAMAKRSFKLPNPMYYIA